MRFEKILSIDLKNRLTLSYNVNNILTLSKPYFLSRKYCFANKCNDRWIHIKMETTCQMHGTFIHSSRYMVLRIKKLYCEQFIFKKKPYESFFWAKTYYTVHNLEDTFYAKVVPIIAMAKPMVSLQKWLFIQTKSTLLKTMKIKYDKYHDIVSLADQ